MKKYLINILTPVYNDQGSLIFLIKDLQKIAVKNNYEFNLYVIDDFSDKNDYSKVKSQTNVKITLLRNKMNVGNQASIFFGLNYIKSKIKKNSPTIIMDSDGEDRPSDIPILIKEHQENLDKIVVVKRMIRHKYKVFYNLFKSVFKLLTNITIDFGNFMVLNQTNLRKICESKFTASHLPSAIIKANINLIRVPLNKGKRYYGESKTSFEKLIYHGVKCISIFADIILVNLIKFLVYVLSFLLIIVFVIVLIRLNYDFFIPGQAGLILGIIFILITILLSNALIALFIFSLSNIGNNFNINDKIIKKVEKIK